MLKVNLDLVQKYNVAGPRYTSYPPATRFNADLTWAALAEKIVENNQSERDLSLYFHLPFCETLCWFCGCTTVITTDHGKSLPYIGYLEKEMAQVSAMLNGRRRVVQLHWGGGSPTFFAPDEIRRLGAGIRQRFNIADDVEAGVEIDPRRLTRDHVKALQEAGFSRASLGVQDFNPQVQEAIHRIQPLETTRQVLDWCRDSGFTSINFDLIYGLPFQTLDSFNETLDQVLAMQPDRLAVFSYAHVPWIKPAQKILEQKVLPTPEVKLQLLKTVIERLTFENRYVYIGMDHFARPNDELAVAQKQRLLQRNFQGYSTRAGADIYSFGMSAISQIPDVYWQNEKELPRYCAALDDQRSPMSRGYILTEDDKIRRETIMRVMCDLGLDYGDMSRRLGINFESYFERELEALAPLETDGLLQRTQSGLSVSEPGRLFIRNIAMVFDATLAPVSERRHSRTI